MWTSVYVVRVWCEHWSNGIGEMGITLHTILLYYYMTSEICVRSRDISQTATLIGAGRCWWRRRRIQIIHIRVTKLPPKNSWGSWQFIAYALVNKWTHVRCIPVRRWCGIPDKCMKWWCSAGKFHTEPNIFTYYYYYICSMKSNGHTRHRDKRKKKY